MEERQERQDSHTLEGLSSQVLWTQQRRFLLLMAISRMFSQEGTQLSLRGRGPDPNWQNLSTTSMYKCEKMWVDIPSSQGCGEQTAPGWRTTQGHNKSWAGGTGNGVLEQRMGFWNREWGFWNRGHLEGGKRCDLGEQGQTMRGEKLHLFRWKIKVKRKGRSKTVMINSMGGGHNQLLFPGHKCCLPGDADIGQNTNILLQGQWEQHEKSRNSSMWKGPTRSGAGTDGQECPATQQVTGWAGSNGEGKASSPKGRHTHMDWQGCKLGREHTGIYTNVSRTAPEERKQSSRRVRAGLGNRAKIQGLKNTLFISENVQKQLLQVSFTSDRRGLPSAPNCCKIPWAFFKSFPREGIIRLYKF